MFLLCCNVDFLFKKSISFLFIIYAHGRVTWKGLVFAYAPEHSTSPCATGVLAHPSFLVFFPDVLSPGEWSGSTDVY